MNEALPDSGQSSESPSIEEGIELSLLNTAIEGVGLTVLNTAVDEEEGIAIEDDADADPENSRLSSSIEQDSVIT